MSSSAAKYIALKEYFACPKCGGDLEFEDFSILCKQPGCGALYGYDNGIPVLLHQEDGAISVDDFSNFYDSEETQNSMNLGLGNNAASRRVFLVESIIRKYRPDTCLDLSVGSGIISRIALKHGATHVFGMDISIEALRIAQMNLGPDFVPVKADARALPFAPGSMDMVLNCNLIEHLDRWESCLEMSTRTSRDIIVVSTDTRSLSEDLNFAGFGEHPAGHMHIYNHYKLKTLLSESGTVVQSYLYTFIPYHVLTQLANRILFTNRYGVGKGLRVVKAIPRYIAHRIAPQNGLIGYLYVLSLRLRHLWGRFVNRIFNLLERDSRWKNTLEKKDYPLASLYVVRKKQA